jgi:hypothetical protein
MQHETNSAGPVAGPNGPRFQNGFPDISRKYKYGVCVFKISCAVFRPEDSRRDVNKPHGSS